MCVTGGPELEEKEFCAENVFEKLMAKNFLHLTKDTNLQIQEVQ